MTAEISDSLVLLEPNASPMFGHRHRTRSEKLVEWLYDLRGHFCELKDVFKEDPPSKPGLLLMIAKRSNADKNHWYDDAPEVSDD